MEVRTTKLMQGYLWKEGRHTGLWVRRYYVLIRREQIDEMVNAASDVLHELCCFDKNSPHAEVLSSIELETAITLDLGIDAGLAPFEKLAASHTREENRLAGLPRPATGIGFSQTRRTFFTQFFEMMPIKYSTDEIADYTMQLTFPDRVLRLRAETKSAFDNWRALFATIIPPSRAEIMHEGWVWRQRGSRWQQRYAIIYEGVLFFFLTYEESEKFRQVASRGPDSMFVAAPLAEDCIGLEFCEVTPHAVWQERSHVLHFSIEDPPLAEYISAVDEAQLSAWELAIRNARHWFESLPDEHPTRRLFGGLGGGDDGPVLASNTNPLAQMGNGFDMEAEAAAAAAAARTKARAERKAAKQREKARRKKMKQNKRGVDLRLQLPLSGLERFQSSSRGSSRSSRGGNSNGSKGSARSQSNSNLDSRGSSPALTSRPTSTDAGSNSDIMDHRHDLPARAATLVSRSSMSSNSPSASPLRRPIPSTTRAASTAGSQQSQPPQLNRSISFGRTPSANSASTTRSPSPSISRSGSSSSSSTRQAVVVPNNNPLFVAGLLSA